MRNKIRVLKRCQIYKADSVRKITDHAIGNFYRQTCFSAAAGAGQGKKTGRGEQLLRLPEIGVPPNKAVKMKGQVVFLNNDPVIRRNIRGEPILLDFMIELNSSFIRRYRHVLPQHSHTCVILVQRRLPLS